jgi:short-subunit dehydrogenase
MQLKNARILLTGASGGLGQELACQLTDGGAALLLAGRDSGRLNALATSLGPGAASICADLERASGVAALAGAAREFGVNVLINNAGVSAFGLLENQEWAAIERVLATNLEAPIHLTHALLPWLKAQPQAAIVNIGSTFGSLPFPGFVAYSAAKAGLRAFSQALRRELADTRVAVVHIAPRAIDTPMNGEAVTALNRALKSESDAPVRCGLRRSSRRWCATRAMVSIISAFPSGCLRLAQRLCSIADRSRSGRQAGDRQAPQSVILNLQ